MGLSPLVMPVKTPRSMSEIPTEMIAANNGNKETTPSTIKSLIPPAYLQEVASKFYIGTMSGTSLDGVDTVLLSFNGTTPQLIETLHTPFPAELRQSLLDLTQPGFDELNRIGEADQLLGKFYANAISTLIDKAKIPVDDIAAIGSHGQTIRHEPNRPSPFTMQIGDPNQIAHHTGITTIAHFRHRDIVAGGEGAPLVPAFHTQMFCSEHKKRTVVNIGGIANISILPTDKNQSVRGFDTGPGNTLLDSWYQIHHQNNYDHNGEWGASGKVLPVLLKRLCSENYFKRPPPKSTGRELFNLSWLSQYLSGTEKPCDVQATLHELTAKTISQAILIHSGDSAEVVVCGGGANNGLLMQRLAIHLHQMKVSSTSEYGVDPQWVEAMAFAWLARQTLMGRFGNLPAVTGAGREVILGAIYQA